MSRDAIQTAIQVFQFLAEDCTEKGMKSVAKPVKKSTDNEGFMQDNRIPIITDVKEAKEYIERFDFQNPEKMIKFFVEGFVSAIEGCYENLNDLKAQNLQAIIGEIKSAARTIRMGIDNPDKKDEQLSYAQNNLSTASGKLEELLPSYINKIRGIDSKKPWEFFLGAKLFLSDINTNVTCAKQAVEGLNIAVRLQMLIAVHRNMEIGKSVTMPYLNFMKNTVKDDVCDLLNAYDKNKQEKYWLKLPQKIASAEKAIEAFEKYRDNTPKELIKKEELSRG